MALYRKWRVKRFSDVIGQEPVVAALKNQIKSGRFSHAYIFTGVRGIGKTTFARILAKAVNCPNAVDGEPCGECFICKGIDDGSILDVTEIDAASNNGVDNIRDLRDETAFAPTVCKLRVYIIDEVHMLSTGAFNALLKTLEEPPAHVMFILATTEIHKVPATILSRCQRFDLKRITAKDIKGRIMYVAREEGIDLREDGAELISRLADGAMRDALSLLDTCSSLGGAVDEETVSRLAGVADKSYLFDIANDILSGDTSSLLARLSELYRDSLDATRLNTELLRHIRNLLMLKVSPATELTDCSAETALKYKRQSADFTAEQLISILDALGDTADKLSKSPDKMLALELCLIKLCSPQVSVTAPVQRTVSAPVQKAVKPQTEPQKLAAADEAPPWDEKPTVTNEPKIEEAPKTEQAQDSFIEPSNESETAEKAPAADDGSLSEWSTAVEEIKTKNMMLYSLLRGSRAFVTDKYLLIDANELFLKYMRENKDAKELIKSVAAETLGIRLPIGPYTAESAASVKAKKPDKLDSLIEKAKEIGIETEIK